MPPFSLVLKPALVGTISLTLHSLGVWLRGHPGFVVGVGVASALLCVGSLLMTPVFVARLPEDYLTRLTTRPVAVPLTGSSWVRTMLRNLLGTLLLFVGLLLVPLPGPGTIVMLLALGLVDFPAKRRLLAAILRRPAILEGLNWLRRRHGQPDLLPPGGVCGADRG